MRAPRGLAKTTMADNPDYAAYKRRLRAHPDAVRRRLVRWHWAVMAWAERKGLSRQWLGPIFLFSTVMIYAAIGIYGRTADAEEYYVAGRRIPPFYNGMATAADWMSAASFISLAGGLYLQGFSGSDSAAGRPRLCAGLDRRLLPGGAAGRAVPAPARAVHRAGLFRRALRRALAAPDRRVRRHAVLVHLCRRADLRHRPDRFAPDRRAVRDRHPAGAGRRAAVLVPGRHAGDHLDPGGAVRDPAAGLPDPGVLAGLQAAGQPAGAAGLRQAAAEDHARSKRAADGLPAEKQVQAEYKRRARRIRGAAAGHRRVAAARARGRAAAHPRS